MSKELLQKVINDSYNRPAREDKDWVWGILSEDYAEALTRYLPLGPSVKVYRDFRPMRDGYDFNVFVRHNEYGPMRVEFHILSETLESWGENANDILTHIARYHIEEDLPDFEKERKRAREV